jgi:hypothetical protein
MATEGSDQHRAEESTKNLPTISALGERIARRELLKRGGKFVGGLAFFGALAGTMAAPARAGSSWCFDVGCACSHGTCFHNGVTCPTRTTDCQSGGQCWSFACGSCTCTNCDWYCSGTPCRCQKVECPGVPQQSEPDGSSLKQMVAA